MRILCVYATRRVDSNLFMSSTVFNGLAQCGHTVDMAFWGYKEVCDNFRERYSKYFRAVYYQEVKESRIKKLFERGENGRLLYSYYRSFLADYLKRPYQISAFNELIDNQYDVVLSFIPPAVSGYLANDIRNRLCKSARLIQFWTDPLSLGRCDSVSEIPWTRKLHIVIERELLSFADKIVFWYPLLCEEEKKLHPQYAHKMTSSGVGYTEHLHIDSTEKDCSKIRIGLFGSYHSKVRNIHPYLEAMHEFPNVIFVLRGDSDLSLDNLDLENLDVLPGRRPIDEIERMEACCDILVCLGGSSGITQPPGKVFYYANYDKPIVYIGDGANNEYFRDYLKGFDRYIICENNVKSICAAIQEAIDILPSFKLVIPDRLEPRVVAENIIR